MPAELAYSNGPADFFEVGIERSAWHREGHLISRPRGPGGLGRRGRTVLPVLEQPHGRRKACVTTGWPGLRSTYPWITSGTLPPCSSIQFATLFALLSVMRMQPCETALPIEAGLLVPWMKYAGSRK